MKKVEWGTKRICLNCEKPFYDLLQNPELDSEIKCPECGKSWKLEDFLLLQAANLEKSKRGVRKVKEDLEDFSDVDDGLIDPSTDNSLMEDTSDLGDDNLDMAEVTDNASTVEKGDE